MITKGEIVNQAFQMLMISGVTAGASNEDISLALRSLESMVLSWERSGVYIGYIKSTSFDDIDHADDSGIADTDYFAVYTNLAVRLAPAFGKNPPPQLTKDAKKSYSDLFSEILIPVISQPNMPLGAGDRRYGRCKFQGSQDYLEVQQDGNIDDVTI